MEFNLIISKKYLTLVYFSFQIISIFYVFKSLRIQNYVQIFYVFKIKQNSVNECFWPQNETQIFKYKAKIFQIRI